MVWNFLFICCFSAFAISAKWIEASTEVLKKKSNSWPWRQSEEIKNKMITLSILDRLDVVVATRWKCPQTTVRSIFFLCHIPLHSTGKTILFIIVYKMESTKFLWMSFSVPSNTSSIVSVQLLFFHDDRHFTWMKQIGFSVWYLFGMISERIHGFFFSLISLTLLLMFADSLFVLHVLSMFCLLYDENPLFLFAWW